MFTDPLFVHQSYLSGLSYVGQYPLTSQSPVIGALPILEEYRGRGVTISMEAGIEWTHPELLENYSSSALALYDPMKPGLTSNWGTFMAGIAAADDNGVLMVGVAPDAQIASRTPDMPTYDIEILTPWASPDRSWDPDSRDGLGTITVMGRPQGTTNFFALQNEFDLQGVLNSELPLASDRHNILVTSQTITQSPVFTTTNDVKGGMAFLSTGVFTSSYMGVPTQGEWTYVNGIPHYDVSGASGQASDQTATWGLDLTGDAGSTAAGDGFGYWELLVEQEFGEIPDLNSGDVVLGDGFDAGPAIVAGGTALMLEANPDLSWRDVQNILALSANPMLAGGLGEDGDFASLHGAWEQNEATNLNGAGFWHNPTLGFGALDIFAAVRLAESWESELTTENELHHSYTPDGFTPGTRIGPFNSISPDDDTATTALEQHRFAVEVDQQMSIEHVYVTLDFSLWNPYFGDEAEDQVDDRLWSAFNFDTTDSYAVASRRELIENTIVTLVAPDGSRTVLAAPADGALEYSYDFTTIEDLYRIEASFGTRVFWGEDVAQGDWAIEVDVQGAGDYLTFENVSLDFYGAEQTDDDTYYFNAFAVHAGQTPSINDAAGDNTINAAMVGQDVYLTGIQGARAYVLTEDGRETNLYSLSGTTNITTLQASDGNDTLMAGANASTLKGGRGNDLQIGQRSDDFLMGEIGNDTLIGNQGRDSLFGGLGNDFMKGGNHGDLLEGAQGRDSLSGGAGQDTLNGGQDADILKGGRQSDRLLGGSGRDRLSGEQGNDMLLGGNHGDVLRGGGGRDHLEGNQGRDTLWGGSGRDELFGQRGADVLNGGASHDLLLGGSGRDALNGSRGHDTLNGGSGNDNLAGGSGRDVFVFAGKHHRDRILDFQQGADAIDLSDLGRGRAQSFEDLRIFTRGDDLIILTGGGRIALDADADLLLAADDFIF